MTTFKNLSEKYIKYSDANMDTKLGYQRILNKYWLPIFTNKRIDKITYDMIMESILGCSFDKNKTLNNCLTPLRGVFNLAYNLGYINKNPMDLIKNKKIQLDLPDPFTKNEMDSLLLWLNQNMLDTEELYYWYYLFMFWSGLRPSEMFALRWSDVDLNKKSIYVHRSRVRGVEKNVTKTYVARWVYLNNMSYQAVVNLQKFHNQYVVICPNTNAPFYNDKPPRIRLQRAMSALNIRLRPAYNTRHTYATLMLMSGINPVFVANQLGHSLPMLMKRYARWLNNEQDLLEMSKLNKIQ